MCSIGRRGVGARAAPVSATGRRAGGRFDVDRVRGHDKMHRDACSASRAGPHTPQWSRTTPREARAGVHLLLRLLPEPRCIGARGPHLRCASRGSARLFQPPSYCSGAQFSFRPSLVPSVTVVLLRFSDRWERGEGRLAKPGAGLIQPLCRRDGHGLPGCQGEKPQGAQAPSHAGICQMGAVREGGALPARNQLTGPLLVSGLGARLELRVTLWNEFGNTNWD